MKNTVHLLQYENQFYAVSLISRDKFAVDILIADECREYARGSFYDGLLYWMKPKQGVFQPGPDLAKKVMILVKQHTGKE